MAIVTAVLPNLFRSGDEEAEIAAKARFAIWEGLLLDLTDEQFLRGVRVLCLERTEIFPNTNIIALIRVNGIVRESNQIVTGPSPSDEEWARN